MAANLESRAGQLVKLVWNDGDETKVKKGTLAAVGQEFLELRTYDHTYLIKRAAVISVKTLERER